MTNKTTQDFVVRLLTTHGSFTFSTRTKYNHKRERSVHKIPTFILQMDKDNVDVMESIKKRLGLRNKIYFIINQKNDGIPRKDSVKLIVRELRNIEGIIIPFFSKNLKNNQAEIFNQWLLTIEKDPLVPFSFKKIYWRHKAKFV